MKENDTHSLISDHSRDWRDFKYVYPVISRRSGGLSIGVNLNIDKRCTFSCIYCQVDRSFCPKHDSVDIKRLEKELRVILGLVSSGEFWKDEKFAQTPPELRRVNDIAFSGNGEPTMHENFDLAVKCAADVAGEFKNIHPQLIIITNSTQFQSPQFQRAMDVLDKCESKIWAKLDAGTEEYFQIVNRPAEGINLQTILDGIIQVSRRHPLIIQTLFSKIHGELPSDGEISAWCGRIRQIAEAGGDIEMIQIHTVIRPPAESYVSAIDNSALDAITAKIREQIPAGIEVRTYYGK